MNNVGGVVWIRSIKCIEGGGKGINVFNCDYIISYVGIE